MFCRDTQKAFSLIELMITILVLAIVIAVAAPSFNQTIAKNRSVAVTEELSGALNYVRSQALTKNGFYTLCPQNSNGDGCGSDWSNGWLAVRDTAASETADPVVANDDAILRRWNALTADTVLTFALNRTYVRFTTLGVLGKDKGVNPVTANVSVKQCKGNSAREISIGLSGLLRVVEQPCS